jgi:lysine 6-dehydrogenase
LDGVGISPLESTSKILFDEWKLGENEPEFTIMRVTVEGEENGKSVSHVWNLYDEYDPETQVSSMSRTTGYTCTAAAELILQGKFDQQGVFPPELVGGVGDCFEFVRGYLKDRGVNYTHSTI